MINGLNFKRKTQEHVKELSLEKITPIKLSKNTRPAFCKNTGSLIASFILLIDRYHSIFSFR